MGAASRPCVARGEPRALEVTLAAKSGVAPPKSGDLTSMGGVDTACNPDPQERALGASKMFIPSLGGKLRARRGSTRCFGRFEGRERFRNAGAERQQDVASGRLDR